MAGAAENTMAMEVGKMVRRTGLVAALLLMATAVLLAAPPVLAREPGPQVVVQVTPMKEVISRDAQGNERVEFQPVSATGPGDTLVYRIAYTNKGDAPAHNARIVDPIPAGTELIPRSWTASGTDLTVSVDGGVSFVPFPVLQTVTRPDGTTGKQEVAPSQYTHLRWTSNQPLAPGETREALFKVIVR
jgi:uncharacterized repeat protein (TIGR01451 family)